MSYIKEIKNAPSTALLSYIIKHTGIFKNTREE